MPVGLAIAQAASTAAQVGIGAVQYFKGKKIREGLERPEYTPTEGIIPESVYQREALANAQGLAQQGLPAEQRQLYEQNLQRGTTTGLAGMTSRKAGLTGLATLNEQQNQGYQGLLAMDAQARMQNQQNQLNLQAQTGRDITQAELQNQAFNQQQQDQAFQTNQLNPYYEGLAEAQGLQGSGMQNIMTGLGNAPSAIGGFAGAGQAPLSNTYAPQTAPGALRNPTALNTGATTLMPGIGQPPPPVTGLNLNRTASPSLTSTPTINTFGNSQANNRGGDISMAENLYKR